MSRRMSKTTQHLVPQFPQNFCRTQAAIVRLLIYCRQYTSIFIKLFGAIFVILFHFNFRYEAITTSRQDIRLYTKAAAGVEGHVQYSIN